MIRSLLAFLLAVGLTSAAAEEIERGATLRVAADVEPQSLNPALDASNGVYFIASKIIEPLVEASFEEGGFEPRLAVAWEGSADGRTITFRLRDGVTWQDGVPFTSADVAYSAMELWSKLQNFGTSVFANLEAVDTPDPLTAVFRFSQPTPLQLVMNALPALSAVVPKHLYEGSDPRTNPLNQAPIGTGPFRFVEHEVGIAYVLERNPDYWGPDDQPYLERIVYAVLPDRSTVAAAHEAGEIDISAFSKVPLPDLERIAAEPGLEVVTEGYEALTYQITVEINHRREELADPRVREAMRHAIDPAFVAKAIFLGYATPATGPVPVTGAPFYTGDVATYAYDPARAAALLDEAGYPRGADGWRFALTLRPAPWFEQTRQMGDYLRQQLREIGIDVTIEGADPAGHIKSVYADHDFDLAIGSPVYRGDPAISTTVLYDSAVPPGQPFSNQYGYADPEMDRLIDEAAVELDPARRIELYQDFQRLAAEQLPILHIVDFGFVTVASSRVQNVGSNPRWPVSSWADVWLAADE